MKREILFFPWSFFDDEPHIQLHITKMYTLKNPTENLKQNAVLIVSFVLSPFFKSVPLFSLTLYTTT